jgi:phage baseplate assembly protein W
MIGMDRSNGTALSGLAHLTQSVHDILTTPLGSRIMRRDYGSLIPSLIDQPDNASTRVRLYAAVASALMRWEPRLKLKTVGLVSGQRPGQRIIDIDGVYYDSDRRAVIVSLQIDAMGAWA